MRRGTVGKLDSVRRSRGEKVSTSGAERSIAWSSECKGQFVSKVSKSTLRYPRQKRERVSRTEQDRMSSFYDRTESLQNLTGGYASMTEWYFDIVSSQIRALYTLHTPPEVDRSRVVRVGKCKGRHRMGGKHNKIVLEDGELTKTYT